MDILNVRQLLRQKSIYEISLRVTFYARVSTDSNDTSLSLAASFITSLTFLKSSSLSITASWEMKQNWL